MPRVLLCVCAAILCVNNARAESTSFTATIKAGKHDRVNAPVSVIVDVPTSLSDVTVVELPSDAPVLPIAQLTAPGLLSEGESKSGSRSVPRELHLVVTNLKAGQSLALPVTISDKAPAAKSQELLRWSEPNGKSVDLLAGDRPLLRYMYEPIDTSTKERRDETYKPFHHLFDPASDRLVTKGAGGKFPHHRGLFFGFNKITYGDGRKADVWHATGDAHQVHKKFLSEEAGPLLARHRVAIDWNGEKGKTFATEERELTVYQVPAAKDEPGYLVEFASRVRTASGPVRLDGDPQHAGFHFRAAQEVAESTNKQTYYVRPDGVGKPGETVNWEPKLGASNPPNTVNQPWKGMSFVVGGQRYTAAYLDNPSNPKEARYSERDYGRFGSYFEYDVTSDKPLEVNYRVWLQRGEMTGEEIATLAHDFVEPPQVTVSASK